MAQELKAYNVVATADVNPDVVDILGCTEWAGYDKDSVDAVIAEKDAEKDAEIARLKQHFLHEIEIRDKHVESQWEEIRRITRALWMHRAIVAKLNKEGCKDMRAYNPIIGIQEYKWQQVETKCRKIADKFK